jgi:beta-lactamase superfamily II metal-dependent hydrolase
MSVQGDAGLTVEMLPARHGDAILLTWGRDGHTHRMLVDAGPAIAYDAVSARLAQLDDRRIDLLVMTHIDGDHIEGTILLVNDKGLRLDIGEIWFNGYGHLAGELNAKHGEILGMLIAARGLPWNESFGGGPVWVPDEGDLQTKELCCDLRLTVLGPRPNELLRLKNGWDAACRDGRLTEEQVRALLQARPALVPHDSYLESPSAIDMARLLQLRPDADTAVPNASSIVLLAELDDQRVLLAGDSTPPVLLAGVHRLLGVRGCDDLPLTAFKVPHHGSAGNVTRELVQLLPADEYLVSTDGGYFSHPHDAALATVAAFGPAGSTLVFNYTTPKTWAWNDEAARDTYHYEVAYPEAVTDGG